MIIKSCVDFIHAIIYNKAIIGIKDISSLITFITIACTICNNIRSYTKGIIFGINIFYSNFKTYSLNTKSSTKVELVSISNFHSKVIFIYLFLKA